MNTWPFAILRIRRGIVPTAAVIVLMFSTVSFGTLAVGTAEACGAPPLAAYGTIHSSVSVPVSGTYRVWSRIKAPDATNNSYWLQIGPCAYQVGNAAIPAGSWTWVDYQAGSPGNKLSATLAAGRQAVQLLGTEPGVSIDRVILSTDSSCVPTGTGDNCATVPVTDPAEAGTHDDDTFTYMGAWAAGTAAGTFNNNEHYSSTAGSTYSLSFSGTRASIYTTKNSHHGIMAVSIDGGPETMVDTYASARQNQVLAYTSPVLASGTHTVRVRVTGTKNAAASGTAIAADRIDISAGTVPPPAARGDFDGDGKAAITDLSILLSNLTP